MGAGPAAAPPPPPAPPQYTGDPVADNDIYYQYMNQMYKYQLEVSSYEQYRQSSAKTASEGKKILEYSPLSGH